MRSLATYLAAGALIALAMDVVAPPVGWATIVDNAPQTVNRAGKADRLPMPMPIATRPVGHPPQRILVGCELAFSPLAAVAQSNFPGRCVA